MMQLISLTQARSNLSKLVTEVVKERKKYVLIRGSVPQAVIIPWEEFKAGEEKWQEGMRGLMDKGRGTFRKWLKANKMKWPRSEDEVYKVIDQMAGSN